MIKNPNNTKWASHREDTLLAGCLRTYLVLHEFVFLGKINILNNLTMSSMGCDTEKIL